MSFFESDVVRSEIVEISDLQEQICQSVFKFPVMGKREKIAHVNLLQRLLDKQQILYTRLCLSDDPEAIQMKNNIIESAKLMGLPSNVDIKILFSNMSSIIEGMREQIDKSATDL